MTRFPKILFVLSALTLGACSHYSDDLASLDGAMKSNQSFASAAVAPQDIAPAAGGPALTGGSINDFLARDYYELARHENDKAYDYKAAKQFTAKALSAKKGQLTTPSKISSFDVPEERVGELTKARADLIGALKQQNTPENAATLAKAQSSFDCWLERAEEADSAGHYAECKAQFEQSMVALVTPAAGDATSPTYQIAFVQTSAVPDEMSQKLIGDIANYVLAPENTALNIVLSAPSDETGAARVASVQNAFIASGVSPARVNVTVPQIAQPATISPQSVGGTVQATIVGAYVPAQPQATVTQ